MSDRGEHGVPQVPERQLSAFATSLFGYLYFHLNMHSYRMNTSQHFKEVIGRAIFCIRKNTYNFNINVLDNCGYGVDRLTLCQKICSSYPNYDYFKKLYFVSAFILDMMFWWHTNSDAADLSMGPDLWKIIFRNNFESDFEIHGGWQELAVAGNECCELLPNEILPSKTLLPAYFHGVIAAVKELIPPPVNVNVHEAVEKELASLNFEQMEIGDASGDDDAQVAASADSDENRPENVAQVEEFEENVAQVEEFEENVAQVEEFEENVAQVEEFEENVAQVEEFEENVAQVEEFEENQPEKVAHVEESNDEIEENQPEEVYDRSNPHCALGGNVVQTKNPFDLQSEKSGESVSYSSGRRNPRKRRYDTPSKSESDTESDSLSPTKARRKQQ